MGPRREIESSRNRIIEELNRIEIEYYEIG